PRRISRDGDGRLAYPSRLPRGVARRAGRRLAELAARPLGSSPPALSGSLQIIRAERSGVRALPRLSLMTSPRRRGACRSAKRVETSPLSLQQTKFASGRRRVEGWRTGDEQRRWHGRGAP